MPKVRARDSSRCLELLDLDFELFCNLAAHNLRQLHGGRKWVSVCGQGLQPKKAAVGTPWCGGKNCFLVLLLLPSRFLG